METPQPPHSRVTLSGHIEIQGELPPRVTGSGQDAAPSPPPPWWKFWRGAPETILARATVLLALATLLLFFVAVAQAIIAVVQAHILQTTDKSTRKFAAATQEQVEISRLNFRMDQRPYILIQDFPGTFSFPNGQKAKWNIQYINYGKSPSVKEATEAYVWVGKSAISQMEDFFKRTPNRKPDNSANFVTPPNATARPGENGFHYVTLFSDTVVTPDDGAFMQSHDGGVVMAGRVWYSDVFGDDHSTDVCRYTLMSGGVSDCPRHNEIR
jgi:hypothetical protein